MESTTNRQTDRQTGRQTGSPPTHVWCEDLDPARLLLPASVLEAEGHALLVRVPALHLGPFEGDHLILEHTAGPHSAGLQPALCPRSLLELSFVLLLTGETICIVILYILCKYCQNYISFFFV